MRNSWQEWTKAMAKPHLDEGRIVEGDHVDNIQPKFSNGIQNHGGRRIVGIELLQQYIIQFIFVGSNLDFYKNKSISRNRD